jgi:leucine-zipper of insertion element IS481
MSKARLVITAVTVEKRPVTDVARAYGVARSWIYELLARYRAEGKTAFEPAPDVPHTRPRRLRPRSSTSSCSCANSSSRPVTTPAPTPCAGT